MSGPIVRSGASPEFSKNWGSIFGKPTKTTQPKAAKAKAEETKAEKTKSSPKKAAKKKAAKK